MSQLQRGSLTRQRVGLFLTALAVGCFFALWHGALSAEAGTGSISGSVFEDVNNNGLLDSGEVMHPYAAAFLDANANGVQDAGELYATTDAAGMYVFYNLDDGAHTVVVMTPDGWGATTSASRLVTVSGGGNVTAIDFGISNVGVIAGTVFNDVNGDGARQVGDGAQFDRQVYLDANANGVLDTGEVSTRTNPAGAFNFPNLTPSATKPFKVRLIVPTGSWQSSPSPQDIFLQPGQTKGNLAFALFTFGNISGSVYDDLNCNGSWDVDETGLSAKTVYLDTNNNEQQDSGETTAVTNTSGAYIFSNIRPGTYRVRVITQVNVNMRSSVNPSDVIATSAMNSMGNDIGVFTYGSAAGVVYTDTNANGLKDATGESGQSNRVVYADENSNNTRDIGEPYATTGSSGTFTISGLTAGMHSIRIEVPSGYTLTSALPGAIEIKSRLTVGANNFGLYQNVKFTGKVYNDVSGNGVWATGELGLAGIPVFIDANNNGVLDGGEMTQTTDVNGLYSFNNLGPSSYLLRAVLPSERMQTSPMPALVTPKSGVTTTTDFGLFSYASYGGTVYTDVNGDGKRQSEDLGRAGVTVYLEDDAGAVFDAGELYAVTDADGAWSINGIRPGSYRPRVVLPPDVLLTTEEFKTLVPTTSGMNATGKDFALFDVAIVSGSVYRDFNGNKLREIGEEGLLNKSVFLDKNGDGILNTGETKVTTDASGNFVFNNLGPGTYVVRFAPAGTEIQTTDSPAAIATSSGSISTTTEFGVFTYASIGGIVFDDKNGNGLKETGDSGLASRTVYIDANNNGTLDTGERSVASASTTGAFTIPNISPGTFIVRTVLPADTILTTPEPAAVVTTSGLGITNMYFGQFKLGAISGVMFNDVNGDKIKAFTELGIAGNIVYIDANSNNLCDADEVTTITAADGAFAFANLLAGTYNIRAIIPNDATQTTLAPTPIVVTSGTSDKTIKIGTFYFSSISGVVYDDYLGNKQYDLPGDFGVSGITVFLDANANNVLDSSEPKLVTDSDGKYAFTGLLGGPYQVRVIVPNGTFLTTTLPTDIRPTSGAVIENVRFGLYKYGVVTGVAYEDADGDAVQDATEVGLANVKVYNDVNMNLRLDTGEPSGLTDGTGAYVIGTIKSGPVKIRALLDAKYVMTTSMPDVVTAVSGSTYGTSPRYDFGAFETAIIAGTVYRDANANAVRDTDEAGTASRTVYLDNNNDGIKQSGEPSVSSTTNGVFTLRGLGPGPWSVRVVVPTGSERTTTNPDPITLTSGQVKEGVEFGIRTVPTSSTGTTGNTGTTTPSTPPPKDADGNIIPQDAMSLNTGYLMVSANGTVYTYGGAKHIGDASRLKLTSPIVSIAPTVTNKGYWLAAADGGIFAFGDAAFYGSMGGKPLNKPIVGMAPTPSGGGYYLVASDGGIFAFGDAPFFGSMGGKPLNLPIVAIEPTYTGRGYWMVASDGGIFAFGDAAFYGSMGGKPLNKPIVGMARAAGGKGYWMVASDGGVFAFGTAPFYGSTGGKTLSAPIVSLSSPFNGDGYWMIGADGAVYNFGVALKLGEKPKLVSPIVN